MSSESVKDAAGDGFRYAYRSHFSDSFRKIFAEVLHIYLVFIILVDTS